MTDGDGEDDGIEDTGAPPSDPRLRIWVDPTGTETHTEEERRRFNIPDQAKATVMPKDNPDLAGEGSQAPSVGRADNAVLIALVAKFPDFDPKWPAKVQAQWFASFEQFMKAGLR